MSESRLEIRDLRIAAGTDKSHEISLEVAPRTIHGIIGQTNAGKSQFLRVIVGFDRAAAGTVHVAGKLVEDAASGVRLPPDERSVAYVFPDFALFSGMTVIKNVGFATKSGKSGVAQEFLEKTGIAELGPRDVGDLTKYEQFQVAVVRALAHEPALVVLDDVFRNISMEQRISLQNWLRETLRSYGATAILATRDPNEAMACDTLSILHARKLLQTGEPRKLYEEPGSARAAHMLGDGLFFPAQITPDRKHVETLLGRIPVHGDQQSGYVLIRPEHVTVEPIDSLNPGIIARVVSRYFQGPDILCELRVEGGVSVRARVRRWEMPAGDRVKIRILRPCFLLKSVLDVD